jgi:Ca2+-transporting ATPase
VVIAACSLGAFLFVLLYEKEGIDRARTAALATLACSQLFHAFNCRSMKVSLFKLKVFSNPELVYATGLSFLLQMAIIYVPVFQPIFKTEALSALDLGMIMVFSSLPLWIMELVKALNRKFRFYNLY